MLVEGTPSSTARKEEKKDPIYINIPISQSAVSVMDVSSTKTCGSSRQVEMDGDDHTAEVMKPGAEEDGIFEPTIQATSTSGVGLDATVSSFKESTPSANSQEGVIDRSITKNGDGSSSDAPTPAVDISCEVHKSTEESSTIPRATKSEVLMEVSTMSEVNLDEGERYGSSVKTDNNEILGTVPVPGGMDMSETDTPVPVFSDNAKDEPRKTVFVCDTVNATTKGFNNEDETILPKTEIENRTDGVENLVADTNASPQDPNYPQVDIVESVVFDKGNVSVPSDSRQDRVKQELEEKCCEQSIEKGQELPSIAGNLDGKPEKKMKKRYLHDQHAKERPVDGSTNPNLKKTEHKAVKTPPLPSKLTKTQVKEKEESGSVYMANEVELSKTNGDPVQLPQTKSEAQEIIVETKSGVPTKDKNQITNKNDPTKKTGVLEHSYHKDPNLEKSLGKSLSSAQKEHHKSRHKHSHHKKDEHSSSSKSSSQRQSSSDSHKSYKSSRGGSGHGHASGTSTSHHSKSDNSTSYTLTSSTENKPVESDKRRASPTTPVNSTQSSAPKSHSPVKHHHNSSISGSNHSTSKQHHSSSSKQIFPQHTSHKTSSKHTSSKLNSDNCKEAANTPTKQKEGSSASESVGKKRKLEEQLATPSSVVKKLKLESSQDSTKKQSGSGSTHSTPSKHKHSHSTSKKDKRHSSSHSSSSKRPRFSSDADFRVKKNVLSRSSFRFGHLMHVEVHPNGGAQVLHSYMDEINSLSKERRQEFSRDFFKYAFHEEVEGKARFVMGIIHGAASYLPDLIEYFGEKHPNVVIKAGVMGKPEVETMQMVAYRDSVHKSYSHGTFRVGPLLQVSLLFTSI